MRRAPIRPIRRRLRRSMCSRRRLPTASRWCGSACVTSSDPAPINATGFGPTDTGGDAIAMAVHIDYASSRGFTPVAVRFNCWIDRRTHVRIGKDGALRDTPVEGCRSGR
ncbi:fumarate hydratase [Paraburkholderia diazotrophica]|uniref:fumarate hydratase n=1 Tax=Paraburkholderia diazotrophica TaxID=667676 RepID=UPI003179D09F